MYGFVCRLRGRHAFTTYTDARYGAWAWVCRSCGHVEVDPDLPLDPVEPADPLLDGEDYS